MVHVSQRERIKLEERQDRLDQISFHARRMGGREVDAQFALSEENLGTSVRISEDHPHRMTSGLRARASQAVTYYSFEDSDKAKTFSVEVSKYGGGKVWASVPRKP